MITTANKEIRKTENISSDYVLSELSAQGITPLRWAIVEETASSWIVSVSYECNKC